MCQAAVKQVSEMNYSRVPERAVRPLAGQARAYNDRAKSVGDCPDYCTTLASRETVWEAGCPVINAGKGHLNYLALLTTPLRAPCRPPA